MNTFTILADGFFMPSGYRERGYLSIRNGKVGEYSSEKPKDTCELIDYSRMLIAPGLVDTHIHGYGGDDVMDLDSDKLHAICKGLVSHGTTSWLPTTLTAPTEKLTAACKMIGEHTNKPKESQVQGVFLEGPWFSEVYKGAQNSAYMGDPDRCMFDVWMEALDGRQMKIALAPERAGAAAFTAYAKELGAVVGLAHSNATCDQARACVDAGATVFIHTFNGMRGLHHREPGMVGAAMTSKDTYCELICDGYHVNSVAATAVIQAQTPNRICLITDAMRAAGMPDGDYYLGDLPVVVEGGTARLKSNGSLAGSILTLDKAVKHVVDWGMVSAQEAIRMASTIPAYAAGIADVCGSLTQGYVADMCVFDHALNLQATYVAGELAWRRKGR